MNRWKIVLAGAVVLLGIGEGCPTRLPLEEGAVEKEDKAMTDNTPIKIGWVGPLSGDAAPLGKDALAAAQLAVHEVNTDGGINGRVLELIPEDTQCSANVAFHAGNKLIAFDQVHFIVGGICSDETLAIAPSAEKNKVIVFSGCSGSPEVTTAGEYIFRAYPVDSNNYPLNVASTTSPIPQPPEDWIQKLAVFGGSNTRCAPGVYNSIHMLAYVLRQAGEDPVAVKNGLYAIREYPGVNGPVTLDENGDMVSARYDVKIIAPEEK